ncbi:MAG: flagellar protein FliS, partial [Novosphingobium sp.]|nr:flagellar protein FliS [Novosphingobium sp.]
MHPRHSPQETYRRVDFDARVAGADPRQLVALCYEQLIAALGSAIYAATSGDNALKSASLTRALAALTALQL